MLPHRRSSGRRQTACYETLFVYTVLLLSLVGPCAARDGDWPVVHLRTTEIYTKTAGKGLESPTTRRRLLHHSCHTEHPSWGVLRDARQAMVSHKHGLGHAERHALLTHIESSGARVMGYLPENTLVMVGVAESLAAAANHSLVVWSGYHEPTHKVAPEWHSLIEQIEAIVPGGAADFSKSLGNATEAAQALAAAALAQLPVRVQHRLGEWPQVGIRVAFPVAHDPQPQPLDHPDAEVHSKRIERVLLEQHECIAGTAAAADWEPLLRDLFGNAVEVHAAGPSSAVVFAPPQKLHAVVEWLAERPAVRWVAPLPRTFVRNREASVIIQASRPAASTSRGDTDLDPSLQPVWAAGITGKNQVVGQGDSGLDYGHCFFDDPNVDFASGVAVVGRVRTFQSTVHRKIRLYRAFADFLDANGHGTHTAGTLAGIPYGTDIAKDTSLNVGMAPDAKLAFIDLSSASDGDAILTPYDLVNDYFPYTTAVGAAIHSDSWGSTSITYDNEAVQVDEYCWKHPTFLPVFPAGNDGAKSTQVGNSGDTTVNSPATSKNCIAAGATQTSFESAAQGQYSGKVWAAKATLGPNLALTFRVLLSDFSVGLNTLNSGGYPLVAATPLQACSLITSIVAMKGAVALVERGTCTFVDKAKAAQAAGAVAVLVFDDQAAAYFVAFGDAGTNSGIIPTATMPRRLGQNMMAVLSAGRAVNITFGAATEPQYGFENLASFSSQGPVGRDKRVKPDLVAPGTVTSADFKSSDQCGVATYGGTSMATPVIAGAAILVRQYFQDGYYPSGAANPTDGFEPTSALIKAVMVAGASSLQGYEADTGLPIDPTPSFRQGFGRVFLGQSLFLQNNPYSPVRLSLLDAVPINTGDVHQYCITAGGGPLSIALVWTDYPGEQGAARSLVNDLDLVVRAEGLNGQPLLGNGGDVDDSSKPDSANNIEQVTLVAVPAGRVSVEVRGSSVQAFSGPQPYALVINGDFGGALAPPSGNKAAEECAVVVASIAQGPGKVTNQKSVSFTLSTTSGVTTGVAFECRLVDDKGSVSPLSEGTTDWAPCSSPVKYDNLADGTFTFSVRAVGEKIDTSTVFTKDTSPPVVGLQADVPATTTAAAAKMTFTANDTTAVSFLCRVQLDNASPEQRDVTSGSVVAVPIKLGQPFNCTSPQTVSWMLPGKWTFAVEATDAAGNTAAPSIATWEVSLDPAVRYVRLLSGPILKIPKREVNFSMLSLGPDASSYATECALVSGTSALPSQWAACTGSVSYAQPDDGDYTFSARAVGDASVAAPSTAASQLSSLPPTWAVSRFTIDSTPPTANFTSGPTGGKAVSETAVTFEFTLSEEGSTAQCKLDARDYVSDAIPPTACASPVQLTNLTGGHYTFSITPSDAVGNSGEPLTADFIVDSNPPNVTASAMVNADRAAIITFTADDGAAGSGVKNVTCRVRPFALASSLQGTLNLEDPKYDWQVCTSPYIFSGLLEGHWTVNVRAYDNADQPSRQVELDVWVDTIAPVANITVGPGKDAVNPGGRAVFTLTDLTEKASPGAGSPVQWQGLLQTSSDKQQNGTEARTTEGASSATATSSAAETYAVNIRNRYRIEATTVELGRGDIGVWTNCSDDCIYDGLGSGTYTFQARGIDAAGNIGDASNPPYAFQLEGASSGLPTWALIAIIVGSVVAGISGILLLWWCCKSTTRKPGTLPIGSVPSSARPMNGHWGNGNIPPPYLVGGPTTNGYVAPITNGYHHSNGNGYPGTNGAVAATNGRSVVPQDPIEAQQIALALAASQRASETERRKNEMARAAAEEEEAQLRAALAASLAEEQRKRTSAPAVSEDDADIRAAIQASLAEQRRQESAAAAYSSYYRPSAPSPSQFSSNPYGSVEEWPPRR